MDKKRKFLSQIENEFCNINLEKDLIDSRSPFLNAIYECLKNEDFDDKELNYLMREKNIIKKIYNDYIQWCLKMNVYKDNATSCIGSYIHKCELREKYKSEEM